MEKSSPSASRSRQSNTCPSTEQALDILKQNRDLLEQIAQEILEVEVIEGEKLQSLLNQAELPQKHVEESDTVLA